MRPHQWVKNSLLGVPLVLAFRSSDPASLTKLGLAFVAFSLCASAVYLINDFLDQKADRTHPTKRHRPFASGRLPATAVLTAIPLILLAALSARWVSTHFLLILGVYFGLTVCYSFYVKHVVLADVFLLAGLYTTRIVAGAIAIEVPLTAWLLAFSIFFFLSLAFAKRVGELELLRTNAKISAPGRDYRFGDVDQLVSFGSSSAYVAVLVMALFIQTPDIAERYHHPLVLWGICPVILYWLSRIWLLTCRGVLDSDPIVFALKDRASYGAGLAILTLWLLAAGKMG